MIACSGGILEYNLKQLNADIIGSGFLVNLNEGKLVWRIIFSIGLSFRGERLQLGKMSELF